MLVHFVFIPYNGYVVGFSLYLYLRRLNPFPAFSSRNNVGDPSREDRETALMRCIHHLRAASGERSNLHVGLAATTPLFEEETYRKVRRMGRDAPFSAKMNYAHLHQGSHPWPFFLTRAYGTLPTSLFFSSPNASMLAHVALPSCQTEGGYWAGERGLLSTAQVRCGKNGGFDVFLLGYIYLYILLLCYIAICLYIYIGIALFIYCTFGHIRYSIFK